jgi:5-methylcytosine-specific restriction endonuclease McrA
MRSRRSSKRKTEWRKKRKLKQRIQNKLDNHRRRAGGRFSVRQWNKKLEEFDHKCAYCGEPPAEGKTLEVEHMIPISRGGAHDESNIVPACRKCNAQKGEMTLEEWIEKEKENAKHESPSNSDSE